VIWAYLIVILANFLLKESKNYVSRGQFNFFFLSNIPTSAFFFLRASGGQGPPWSPNSFVSVWLYTCIIYKIE
jgi:hypothetical protein